MYELLAHVQNAAEYNWNRKLPYPACPGCRAAAPPRAARTPTTADTQPIADNTSRQQGKLLSRSRTRVVTERSMVNWMFLTAARRISPVLLSLATKTSTASAFCFSTKGSSSSSSSTRGTQFRSSMNSMSTSDSPQDATAGTSPVANEKFVVASCQILCGEDKATNIAVAEQAVKDASAAGAKVQSVDAALHC